MRLTLLIAGALLPACLALSGCGDNDAAQPLSSAAAPAQATSATNLSLSIWSSEQPPRPVDSWALLPKGNNAKVDRVAVGASGLWLLNAAGDAVSQPYQGRFSALDARPLGDNILSATLDEVRDQTLLLNWNSAQRAFTKPSWLPAANYPIESLCFYRDPHDYLYLFLIGEEGLGQQWLLAEQQQQLTEPRLMRDLHLPVGAKYCAVNDALQTLFISEEDIGIWAYPANPETNGEREMVDLLTPYGQLQDSPQGLAASTDGVLAVDGNAALYRYRALADGWAADSALTLPAVQAAERLYSRSGAALELLIADATDQALRMAELPGGDSPTTAAALVEVPAQAQTTPVPHGGDAADDPAIWVNPVDASQSRILGTDKRGGLGVYDLTGEQLQYLPVGRINNVDVRSGFTLAGKPADIAVASNRDTNSLELFAIDPVNGEVTGLGGIALPLDDIYGLCMAKGPRGDIYAIANDKSGRFLQYRLEDDQGSVKGSLVREFSTQTQPEGCVADDARQRLFIGEEGVAVWALSSDPAASGELVEVIRAEGPLHADVEGLAVYQAEQPYLVISSQGNDSYLVLDAEPPYQLRGAFRIGINTAAGIDGVSETDGLEVSSVDFGGIWASGMLVVQDGRKRMPQGRQNFKLVAWEQIADALKLP
ncbi:3-phytase [Halopseudomonas sabulinigri]|uniref:3-phytase n=1 Tax=Halopseudomonas sabulinigri TaxID=472181 RepID=A0A1H1M8F4_9GAMM|nr:phytase [Halopseudomonas sabulinigri]SDR82897.1 3-phytase [Halopseudomonas sabulinigri]